MRDDETNLVDETSVEDESRKNVAKESVSDVFIFHSP